MACRWARRNLSTHPHGSGRKMLEAAMEGLTGVLQPEALMFMCLGVLIGSLVGFLPGIGGPSTLGDHAPLRYDDEGSAARHRAFGGHGCGRQHCQRFHVDSDFRSRQLWLSGDDFGRPSHGQKRRSRTSAERVVRRLPPRRPLRRSGPVCIPAGVATSSALLQLAGIFHSYVCGASAWWES